MNLPLHQQLAFLAGLFCLITLGIFCAEIIRQVRWNREMKRRQLACKFECTGKLSK